MATTPFEPDASDQAEPASQAERTRKIKKAMTWLKDYMRGQPMPAEAVIEEATRLGIARTTLQTAKDRLSIRSARDGKGWTWYPRKRRKKQPVAR